MKQRLSRFTFKQIPHRDNLARGFTLIELLIVVAILGALASLVLISYPASQKKARDTERQSDIKQYQSGIEVYASRNNGLFPNAANVNALCTALSISPCNDDPRPPKHYGVSSAATEYQLWTELEYPDEAGNVQWFVVCSTGQAGYKSSTAPTGSDCDL